MRIYIAGPITGIPDYAERFAKVAKEIEAADHVAVNPALDGTGGGKSWHYYMRRALFLLLTCDAVLFLPGWEGSKGATFERDVAEKVGMMMFADLNTLWAFGDSIEKADLGDIEIDTEWGVGYDDGDEIEGGWNEDEAREGYVAQARSSGFEGELGFADRLLRRTVVTIHYPWEVVERRDS